MGGASRWPDSWKDGQIKQQSDEIKQQSRQIAQLQTRLARVEQASWSRESKRSKIIMMNAKHFSLSLVVIVFSIARQGDAGANA